MFLIRAAFWIVVVSLLMPHEPDLGLGRAETGFTLLDQFHSATAQSLAEVKAQLAARHLGGRSSPI